MRSDVGTMTWTRCGREERRCRSSDSRTFHDEMTGRPCDKWSLAGFPHFAKIATEFPAVRRPPRGSVAARRTRKFGFPRSWRDETISIAVCSYLHRLRCRPSPPSPARTSRASICSPTIRRCRCGRARPRRCRCACRTTGCRPSAIALSVDGTPPGWTATLLGGGQPVAAAMPATDQSVSLQLRLDVPANADLATQTLTVKAEGRGQQCEPAAHHQPRQGTAGQARGHAAAAVAARHARSRASTTPSTIKNDSGRNLTVSFAATAPRNFETSFTEAYGTQELSSVPVEAGASKDVKLKVRPPSSVDAGTFPIEVTVSADDATAKTELTLEIVGQPRLTIAGRDGLVSARAVAGEQSTVPIIVANDGTAPADNIDLSGSAPTGWKISFEPKTIERIAPNATSRSQRADHADRQVARRRLHGDDPRRVARRERLDPVPRDGRHLDHLGHGRRRRHRRGAAADGRRGREVRTAMSEPGHHRARSHQALRRERRRRRHRFRRRSRARSSACWGRTAPARPRPS